MILFSPEYIQYTLLGIVLLPGLIFATITSIRVNANFNKYNQVLSSKSLTGAVVAKKILEAKGIFDVEVVKNGDSELSDHYNPKTKTISLSSRVYDGMSIASIGVAAHETGHAIQDAENYLPLKIRSVLSVTGGIMSTFVWPLIVIGIILDFAYIGGIIGKAFLWAGVAFFTVSLLFSLVTLPVEINASKRALNLLVSTNCLDEMEVKGAKKVLTSAAMTYVASIVVSILQLVRFILFFLINTRDDS